MAKNKQTPEMIQHLTLTAFPGDQIAAVHELTEGLCNAAYMIELSSGIRTVLKISSADNSGLLRNEIDMPETEVAALQFVGEKGVVKVPNVYYYDFSQTVCTGKYFFMEALEGSSFASAGYMLSDSEKEGIYRSVGGIIKDISQIKSKRFGSLVSAENQYDTLFELIFRMISNVLNDAEDKNIDLGVNGIEVLDRLRDDKYIFDEVTESTLIHEDMWEGNVFIKGGSVVGVIDWERAMWGDPLMEEYFRNHHYVEAFYEGYGCSEFTENEKKRTYWYDLFLFLTMLTEPAYREYEDPHFNDWAIQSLKETCEKLMIHYRRIYMAMKDKMHTCELYLPGDAEIMKEQTLCMEKLYDYNATRPLEGEKRTKLLKEMFAEIGEGCYIEPPLHANWGGHHVHFGKGVYANFGLTLVDDTHIYVGDYTLFGPNVIVATAGHPILPELREQGYQYNASVRIGRNCWIGAGVVIVPGITIGDNVVIGAGSVVTKDLPDNVVAVGNPCRVLREVNEHDREYYFKDRKIELE